MHKYVFAAALAAVASSPVSARDRSAYFGVDVGGLFATGTHVDGKLGDQTANETVSANDIGTIEYKTGYDADLVAGYDFGPFRLEAEGAYKHASLDHLHLPASTLTAITDATGIDIGTSDIPLQGRTRVLSGMVNGLLDANVSRIGVYAGGGIGIADVRYSGSGVSASDSKFAWQLLAGFLVPVSPSIDVGLKYRYFHTSKLRFSDTGTFDGDVITGELSGRFTSHSLLASMVYNFGATPAPVAPPAEMVPAPPQPQPPQPQVQTCPDGSVVPVSATCPPAPPPSPPAAPAGGERG